jgi:hypothetical protein
MEELSVKEFAERQGLGEMQVRRVLEHPEKYPWERYGISHAYKIGHRWKIQRKDTSVVVVAPGADKLLDRTALLASSFEEQYPLAQLLTDLQTRPLAEVVNNMLQRFPPPVEVARRVTETGREGPPPPEVLFKIKSLFH